MVISSMPGSGALAGEVVRLLREGMARAELARWKAVEVPRRMWIAVGLAAALVAVAFFLPSPGIERRLQDLRVRTSPARAPDPRILLITIDEASLDSNPLSLADRGDEIGRTLLAIFDAGARAVAIDLLLPAKWSASRSFSDLVLRHPETLTLAAFSAPDGSVVGPECLDGLTAAALGPRASQMFGFVNLDEDPDGAIRRGRLRFRDRSGNERPSWAGRAAGWTGEPARELWIDARIDWPRYSRISWRQVSTALRRSPGMFRDRLVLVGGELRGSGDDYHRIAGTAVSGLTLQALMVDTILAGLPVREPGRVPVLAAMWIAISLSIGGMLCGRRAAVWITLTAAGVYLALSFPAFWWTGLMLPVAAPLLLLALGLLAAIALRRILPSPPEVPAS